MPESLRRCPDDRLAACLDGSGSNEQAAGTEPVRAHAGDAVLEVTQGGLDLIFLDAVEAD
jgi:hypothetical protein